jgi:hypothetical protein
LTRLSHRPGVLGAVVLTAALAAAGCGAGSSSSSGSGTSPNSAFRQCLERHGVTPPQGGPFGGGGGTGTPRPRPTGSAAGSFRQAVQACGGFRGGAGSAG